MNLDKNGLEAALDAHVLGTCPVHEYLDFNAADAKELGVLLPDGESFSVVDIVRHEQWRAASRAILAKAIEAYLAALPGTGDELVADLEHFFDPRDEHEPADVRALALRMAVERGGQTCPVSSYDITNAREQITGEVKEADRLRRELRAAEASLASAREDALNAALGAAMAELALMTELAGKWRDEGDEAAMDRVNSAARSADRIATAIRALKEVR